MSQYSQITGIQVIYTTSMGSGVRSAGVQGSFLPTEALSRLLAGTGLTYRFTRANAITLEPAPSAEAGAVQLGPVRVSGSSDDMGSSRADQTVATAWGPAKGYVVEKSPTSVRSQQRIVDLPFSMQAVPERLRLDQAAISVRESVENVSGTMAGPTTIHEDVLIRGFQIRDVYRNGIPIRRIGMTEVSNADSVTVIKGPAGIIFGRGEAGGSINVETKRPLGDSHLKLQQRIGSYDYYETMVDAATPVTDTVALRVNGLYRNSSSFRDNVSGERFFIAPSLRWQPSDRLTVHVDAEVYRDTYPNDLGLVALGTGVAPIPISRNFSGSNPYRRTDGYLVTVDGRYALTDSWSLRTAYAHTSARERGLEYQRYPGSILGLDDSVVARLPRDIRQRDIRSDYGMVELWGNGQFAGVTHEFVVGIDRNYSPGEFDFRDGDPNAGQFDVISIFDPVVNSPFVTGDDRLSIVNTWKWTGLYVQDYITLNDALSISAGLRYDWGSVESFNRLSQTSQTTKPDGFSPRLGVIYRATPTLNLFAQATRSVGFENQGTAANGQPFKPQIGEQIEAGVKYESVDGRIRGSVALFDLVKRNVLVPDLRNPGFDTQSGRAGSYGAEFDFAGQVSPNLNILAAYTLMKARTLESTNPDENRKELYGVPRHSGRLFLRYDLDAVERTGPSFGGGVYAASRQQGDNANSFTVPGYARLDAFASYRLRVGSGFVTLQVNGKNLTDKRYYQPSGNRVNIGAGTPRTVIATISAEF